MPRVKPRDKSFYFNLEKFQDTFQRLIKIHKISMHELSRQTEIPISTIQRLKSDQKCNPTISSLIPIAQYFNVSLDGLVGNEQPKTKTSKSTSNQQLIPLITWRDVIPWLKSKKPKVKPETFIPYDGTLSDKSLALKVFTDAWNGFQKDMILVIDPDRHPKSKNYVIVQKKNVNEVNLKKFLFYEGNYYLASV